MSQKRHFNLWGVCPGGICPGGISPGGICLGVYVWGVCILGGICPGGKCPGEYMSGGKCPGGTCPFFFVLSPFTLPLLKHRRTGRAPVPSCNPTVTQPHETAKRARQDYHNIYIVLYTIILIEKTQILLTLPSGRIMRLLIMIALFLLTKNINDSVHIRSDAPLHNSIY